MQTRYPQQRVAYSFGSDLFVRRDLAVAYERRYPGGGDVSYRNPVSGPGVA